MLNTKKIWILARVVMMLALLFGMAAGARPAQSAGIAIDNGYVDVVYGAGVDTNNTGVGAESKVWYADGIWWGALFNAATSRFEIYRYDSSTFSWISTGFALDTRDDAGEVGSTDKDNRLDTLFKDNKLYVVSHVDVLKGVNTSNSTQWGKLFRYTYNPATDSYTLDGGFTDVSLNKHRTESLAFSMADTLQLWTTFVAETPTSNPAPRESHVWVNWSGAGSAGQATWGNALDLVSVAAIGADANVSGDDISTVISYGTKTGVLWSNELVDKFFYAEHDNTQAGNAGWTKTDLSALFPGLTANDRMRLLADAAGNVYAVVKTGDTDPVGDNSNVGVLKRAPAGTWTWHQVSVTGGVDTNPTAALNETTNVLTVFVASNTGGGLICANSAPTATMAFTAFNCSNSVAPAARVIYDADVYQNFDYPTTSKANLTTASGIMVLASDEPHDIYGHNQIGGTIAPPPPLAVTATSPVSTLIGSSITATATFNNAIQPATLNTSSFTVSGPGGPVTGTVSYNAATRTASFASTGALTSGNYTATITTAVKDTNNDGLDANHSWQFAFTLQTTVPKLKFYLPVIRR